jgi:hypothetical protein
MKKLNGQLMTNTKKKLTPAHLVAHLFEAVSFRQVSPD